MWKCPKCNIENESGQNCSGCGLDETKDYVRYRVLGRLPSAACLWHKKEQFFEKIGPGEKDMKFPGIRAEWYEKAAAQGCAEAQYSLAHCYFLGHGVPKDKKLSMELNEKAAAQGHSGAQGSLGDSYYYGSKEVPKDYERAISWYEKSAGQGDVRGQYGLGNCYYYGFGVPRDYEKARQWYEKAANQGDALSMLKLGEIYEKGLLSPVSRESLKKAVFWYQKVADEYKVTTAESALERIRRENPGLFV